MSIEELIEELRKHGAEHGMDRPVFIAMQVGRHDRVDEIMANDRKIVIYGKVE